MDAVSSHASFRDLVALTKPRVSVVVVGTAAAGAALAPGHASPAKLLLGLVGTVLIVGAASALNMWWERDVDALMDRTKDRPLPAGRMEPEVALVFALGLCAAALPLLFAVNLLTGLLGLFALASYVLVYTPMKRITPLALEVGAIPGAIPPLMGWTAVTGRLDAGGLYLFALLFLWQVPHFVAISIFRKDDYSRAGLQVHAVARGERTARVTVASSTFALVLLSLAPLLTDGPLGKAGLVYGLAAALAGGVFARTAALGLRPLGGHEPLPEAGALSRGTNAWARRVFGYSILYLLVILGSLLVDRGLA